MRLAWMFVGVLLSSCAYYAVKPNYVVTKTGTAGEPKPAGCDFAIVTTKVDRPYEEVALLDRTVAAENAGSFKQAIAEDVCKLGGDAVFAEVNGAGSYVRGTVLRWKDNGAGK